MSAVGNLDRFLEVGIRAARQAGQIAAAMQPVLTPEQVSRKKDNSPVTQADLDADKAIVEILTRSFPEHKVCSEESEPYNRRSNSPYTWAIDWAIDPIDGTWALINQENTASVSLTLIKEGVPIVGVVYNPFVGELFHTAEGRTAMLGERVLPIQRPVPRGERIGVLGYQ